MNNYISVTEYSKKNGIDGGTVRRRIAEGRIEAIKVGNQWCIPCDTPLPADARIKSGKYKNWRKKPLV